MYAVVCAAKHICVFLLCRFFLLKTNHMAVINLLRRDLLSTTRVQQWILCLFEYVFEIVYQREITDIITDIFRAFPLASKSY